MEQNLPTQDSIVSVNNQNLKSAKPKRKIHIPKIAILIGFFIVLLILMEGGLYLAKKSKSNSTPTPTPAQTSQVSPTSDPTEEWLTYEGDGFNFKYPENFEIRGTIRGASQLKISPKIEPCTNNNCDYADEIVFSEIPNTTLDKYSKQNFGNINNLNPLFITIDGFEGIRSQEIPSQYPVDTVFIENNRSLWLIAHINLSKNSTISTETFNKVLSSFKFTNPQLTCTPRPSCLDSIPACKIPITDDMCPPSPNPTVSQTQTACTLEAKLCPDGVTSVGRSGPNCEFEKCPGE